MNIFILSEEFHSPKHFQQNAKYHIDKHVVKMILESTQMLSTVLRTVPVIAHRISPALVSSTPCKPLAVGMQKHPCNVWTGNSIVHFNYLARLALALCHEHQYRYPLCADHEYTDWLKYLCDDLDDLGYLISDPLPEVFAVAVKSEALRSTATPHLDAVKIYRDYYYADKQSFASWKGRTEPVWWTMRALSKTISSPTP